MPNYQKLMAMAFSGLGALYLLNLGYIEAGAGLLGAILGFAIGEANGIKRMNKELLSKFEETIVKEIKKE